MLTVTDRQLAAFLAERRTAMIDEVHVRLGDDGRDAAVHVAEAFAAGMTIERDVVALAVLLARADRSDRSDRVRALVADRTVPAELRLYQVAQALDGGGA